MTGTDTTPATPGETPTAETSEEDLRPDRLSALRDAGLLDDETDPGLDRMTSLAASLLEVPRVLVSLTGDDAERILSCAGSDCDLAVGDEPPDEDDVTAYLDATLTASDGRTLGTMAAADDTERDWSDRERRILEDLAASTATELELRLVAAERDRLRERLEHASLYDSLTGLAARNLLRDRLEHALDRAQRTGASISVLYLDLDDFRRVNAEYGRDAGDQVLVRTAGRLESEARDQDTLGRLGRDQFALVLEDVDSRDQVAQIASRLHDIVAQPVEIGDATIECGASIGYLLTSPEDDPYGIPASTEPDQLIRMAEQTMHAAKDRGVPYLNAAEAQVTT